MAAYTVSARKHRPRTFSALTGQSHVTTTLQQALVQNRLPPVLLFVGPSGVGKTSCARILAKAINCSARTQAGEPCNACASCQAFNQQKALNIHELDAASHNSVEHMKGLVEQMRYMPPSGKYKVYVIDEVHALSQPAFQKLLLPLEEPPAHVVCILATTEVQKIPLPIISRCQTHHFNRIAHQDIITQLQHVAQQEKISYEQEALYPIADKARGNLREALSTFDQLVTFSPDHKLTRQSVLDSLHVLDHAVYFELLEQMKAGASAALLRKVDSVYQQGFDGHTFLTGLSAHLRHLLLAHNPVTHPLLAVSPTLKNKYITQSQSYPIAFLEKALNEVHTQLIRYKQAFHQRLHVELTLINMAQLINRSPYTMSPVTSSGVVSPTHQPTNPKPAPRIPSPAPSASPSAKATPSSKATQPSKPVATAKNAPPTALKRTVRLPDLKTLTAAASPQKTKPTPTPSVDKPKAASPLVPPQKIAPSPRVGEVPHAPQEKLAYLKKHYPAMGMLEKALELVATL